MRRDVNTIEYGWIHSYKKQYYEYYLSYDEYIPFMYNGT